MALLALSIFLIVLEHLWGDIGAAHDAQQLLVMTGDPLTTFSGVSEAKVKRRCLCERKEPERLDRRAKEVLEK